MIERAVWGRTALGWQGGRGRAMWRAAAWLGQVSAALSHADGADSISRGAGAPADTAPGQTAQGHDPHAQVAALYELHARAVLGYLCARLPTLDDAEDALAEVFLAALAHCATAGQSPGIGWLLTVARRRSADFYRRRHAAQALTAAMAARAPGGGEGDNESPEGAALRAELVREALARVAALPDDQRDALALRFAAGLRAPQIAAILGKRDEATRALLSRALRRLRKELAE